jgi:two-component system chemotaxis response regulator CheY
MAKTIMTVDDSSSMRQMVSFTLTDAGFTAVQACDGVDAISKVDNQKIDLFITDLNMPNMDGMQLIKQLRSTPAHKFTPILLLTTESHPEKKMECKAAGASGWIVKPFEPDQLLAVIKKVCP